METKYYWLQWVEYTGVDAGKTQEVVTDKHPFIWMKGHDSPVNRLGTAVFYDWKQITVEEYNLFNELNTK